MLKDHEKGNLDLWQIHEKTQYPQKPPMQIRSGNDPCYGKIKPKKKTQLNFETKTTKTPMQIRSRNGPC